jgi:hypothetical protein
MNRNVVTLILSVAGLAACSTSDVNPEGTLAELTAVDADLPRRNA